jgi:6-phosphogluconolactonase
VTDAGKAAKTAMALYSGVWSELTHYEVDVDGAALTKRNSVKLPDGIQYAWPHPSQKFLYVSSSSGGPGMSGNSHHLSAFRIDASGALHPHGAPHALRWRPVHNSVDIAGDYVLVAYNDPSGLSVHRIETDGTIGEEVRQPADLDAGIYGHQIRATPSNRSVILVARGNNATAAKPEDPGALKVYAYKDGRLTNLASVAPGAGLGFGPRHLDFHPTGPWVYVSIERQNQLYVYRLAPDGAVSPEPLFIKDTLAAPTGRRSTAGPIHVHPNGQFVYLTNRSGWTSSPPPGHEVFEGKRVLPSHDSNIAVFAIDQTTGEPTLIQTVDPQGAHTRTFSLDPTGRILVAGNLVPIAVREGTRITVLPAGLAVFRVGPDGRLDFVRKYDVGTGEHAQWWTGMVALP